MGRSNQRDRRKSGREQVLGPSTWIRGGPRMSERPDGSRSGELSSVASIRAASRSAGLSGGLSVSNQFQVQIYMPRSLLSRSCFWREGF